MIIDKVEIYPIKIKLNEPFVISKGPLYHATITLVKIYTSEDLVGSGECCLYRTIYAESQEVLIKQGKLLASLIIGMDAREITRIRKKIDQAIPQHSSIKSAFDIAFYDLNAKYNDLPLFRYLNGDRTKEIYTDMTISLLEKDQMAEKASIYIEEGFTCLKVKLGDPVASKDIERIKFIREEIGIEVPIWIDANQGWNFDQAKLALDGMSDMGIEHCEAPVHATLIKDRKSLVEVCDIPIMGDECVFDHKDAFLCLSNGSITRVNIKLGKSGGISNAMKIASVAQAAEVPCQVGCFSESRLGISALAHFAMAWNNIKYYDLDSPLMHSEDPIIGGITYGKNYKIGVDESPGIGAEYDESFLTKFEKIIIKS